MKQLVLPTLFIIAAIAIFFGFIDPRYQEVKDLRAETAKYDEALQRSKELLNLRDDLLSKYNTFSKSNLDRVEHLLPTNIDNVHLILEVNNIASNNDLMVRNISIQKSGDQAQKNSEKNGSINPSSSSERKYNAVDLNFSITASYGAFREFIKDLEQSLRLIDITSISFTANDRDSQRYDVGIRTYWLK